MKSPLRLSFVLGMLLLPGCGGVTDWAKETFDQGKEHKENKKTVKKYLKSVRIYDQFTTIALFDALWLSDQVRILYADTYGAMHGRGKEVRKTFLRRQLKANDHFVTFYVLSTHQIPLNLKPAQWVLHLKVNGKNYSPTEVKIVELSPEYELFFGSLLTKHKSPYEVRFDRKDPDGKDILQDAENIELYFSGPRHYSFAQWNLGGTHSKSYKLESEKYENSHSK
jgi:hypothetical protein